MRPAVRRTLIAALTHDVRPETPQATSTPGDWVLHEQLHRRAGVRTFAAKPHGTQSEHAPYVLKLLDSATTSEERRLRFFAEVEVGRAVRSPHVVAVLAAQLRKEPHYYVMPRLTGRPLDELLRLRNRLSVAEALHTARQMAAGLRAMHDAQLLHGDVRPNNIIVARDGHATLIDLEQARSIGAEVDPALRCTADAIEYLAPEAGCSRTGADGRSDLYSLGVCLYEMLTGRTPFQEATPEKTLAAHLTWEPPPLRELVSSLPNDVCALVNRLLHKQPLRRPQSAAEAADALARLEIAHLDLRAA